MIRLTVKKKKNRSLTNSQAEHPPAQVHGKLHHFGPTDTQNITPGKKNERISSETFTIKSQTGVEVRTVDFLSGPVL